MVQVKSYKKHNEKNLTRIPHTFFLCLLLKIAVLIKVRINE